MMGILFHSLAIETLLLLLLGLLVSAGLVLIALLEPSGSLEWVLLEIYWFHIVVRDQVTEWWLPHLSDKCLGGLLYLKIFL